MCQRADERLSNSPPQKVHPGAFICQRQGWNTARGPSSGAVILYRQRQCTVGRFWVNMSLECKVLSDLSYPRFLFSMYLYIIFLLGVVNLACILKFY